MIEEREENINRFSKRDHYYSSDIEGTINRMKGDMPNSLEYVFDIARIKKFDLLLQQVEKDSNLYSSVEKEKLISDLKSFYGPLTGWSLPRSRHFGDDEPYNDSNLTLKEYVQKLSTFYNKVDKWSPSLIPTEKISEKLMLLLSWRRQPLVMMIHFQKQIKFLCLVRLMI